MEVYPINRCNHTYFSKNLEIISSQLCTNGTTAACDGGNLIKKNYCYFFFFKFFGYLKTLLLNQEKGISSVVVLSFGIMVAIPQMKFTQEFRLIWIGLRDTFGPMKIKNLLLFHAKSINLQKKIFFT